MFFYPEPEPIEHCIIDVSPSYLTDGIFFTGREVGPTHKRVAKQLSVVARRDNDQVPPRLAEVDDRTLDRWVERSKAWHVDNCGRNAKALHAMMRLFPKEKIDPYFGWKSKVAPFPRSEQYEYRYNSIRDSLMNDDDDDGGNNNLQTADETQVDIERRKFIDDVVLETDPRQGINETEDRFNCAVGDPDDYGYWYKEKLTETESSDVLTVGERFLKEGKQKSLKNIIVNGVNNNRNNNYNSGNEKILKGKEKIYRAALKASEIHGQGEDESSTYDKEESGEADVRKRSEAESKVQNKEKKLNNLAKLDPRWIRCRDFCGAIPSNANEERKGGMTNVLRPYKHEIGTWYSVNKPTRILPNARFSPEGKRSKPEWHFSNL